MLLVSLGCEHASGVSGLVLHRVRLGREGVALALRLSWCVFIGAVILTG